MTLRSDWMCLGEGKKEKKVYKGSPKCVKAASIVVALTEPGRFHIDVQSCKGFVGDSNEVFKSQ